MTASLNVSLNIIFYLLKRSTRSLFDCWCLCRFKPHIFNSSLWTTIERLDFILKYLNSDYNNILNVYSLKQFYFVDASRILKII